MRFLALLLALGGCDRLFLLTQVDPLPGTDARGVDMVTGDAPACAGTFGPSVTIPAGAAPNDLAVGDVTGDGLPDLVVANSGDSSLMIVAGAANRMFVPQQAMSAATGVDAVAIGDVNGDKRVDIADIGGISGTIQVYPGAAGGGFGPPSEKMAGTQPTALRLAYLNADAYLDAVVAYFGATDEDVYFGAPATATGSPTTYAIPTSKVGASSVDAADIDHDGDLDLAFANHEEDRVAVARNVGNSTFSSVSWYDTKMGPNSVTLVDVTGDGWVDLVTADTTSGVITISANDGAGKFVSIGSAIVIPASTMPWSVAHADFDRDGNQDLVVSNAADGNLTVLFGNGTGSFPRTRTLPVGTSPHNVVAADADGDGLADIEVANAGSRSVTVYFNCPN